MPLVRAAASTKCTQSYVSTRTDHAQLQFFCRLMNGSTAQQGHQTHGLQVRSGPWSHVIWSMGVLDRPHVPALALHAACSAQTGPGACSTGTRTACSNLPAQPCALGPGLVWMGPHLSQCKGPVHAVPHDGPPVLCVGHVAHPAWPTMCSMHRPRDSLHVTLRAGMGRGGWGKGCMQHPKLTP